jgi:hypothetical protein
VYQGLADPVFGVSSNIAMIELGWHKYYHQSVIIKFERLVRIGKTK